jgi:hypothetical protein
MNRNRFRPIFVWIFTIGLALVWMLDVGSAFAQPRKRNAEPEVTYPPKLPGGKTIVTDKSEDFLKAPATLKEGVAIAQTPPTVDFLFYPGQNYPGKPWSNWGDSLIANGKYYSAIGDHLAITGKGDIAHGTGTAHVFEYDPETQTLRELVDLAKVLNMPQGHYTPGKIHTSLGLGRDGWLYYATHRGSPRATTDEFHYKGDWIFRTHPETAKTEIVAHAPVLKHAVPTAILDPDRLIFYGSTAPAFDLKDEGIQFFAYDVKNKKLLYSGPDGPARSMILARSTGKVYYVPGSEDGELMRFDPASKGPPQKVTGTHIGIRAATAETPEGLVYTVSKGQRSDDAAIWSFNTKTEETKEVGSAVVGSQAYVASIDADPSGRYLYYVPGAHGGSERDGTAVVQFDVKTGQKKVIAFLDPFYTNKYGFTLKGTYGTALSETGDTLYVTWNISRGTRAWDCCGMTAIHIPESEGQ